MKPLRPIIDGITEHIIKHYAPAGKAWLKLSIGLSKRDDEIIESCRRQKIRNVGDFYVHDKVMVDLYRRIGNQVITHALKIRKKKEKQRETQRQNASPARRRIARRDLLKTMTDCLKLCAIAGAECQRDFEEYLEKLEKAQPEYEYERQYERDEIEM
jgi:hypothetical protein